jgi:hypothetical protein
VNYNPDTKQFNLNPLSKEIKEGISLITAVKNRKESFEEALKTWVELEQIDEIIVVDWDSDESLAPVVEKYQNGKIFLAIVKDQPKWILSFAYNLAARLTTRSQILKIDADVIILPDFFKLHHLKASIFYSGNWKTARNENEAHLNGNVFLYRDDFFGINGYNEFFKTYGWDDSDFFERLTSTGLQRVDFNFDTLYHIPHKARTVNQSPSRYLKNVSDEEWARQNIFINRYLASKLEKWSPWHTMLNFNIQLTDPHSCICQQAGDDLNIIATDLIKEAEIVAMKDRINELGFEIQSELLCKISHDELAILLEHLLHQCIKR